VRIDSRTAYLGTLTGYFGLLFLMLLWLGWLSPPERFPIAMALLLMCGPLLLPLRGLLHGRSYTFAWSSFLALFYLLHGIVEAYSTPADRLYALLEILFSLLFYTGAILYVRLLARERQRSSEPSSDG
jgi:uncharacterized membrane protein